MTPSNLAAVPVLFVIMIGAIVASPAEVLAADRNTWVVSQNLAHVVEPLQFAQADRASKSTVSQKGNVSAHHLGILFHVIRGRGSVMEALGNSWQATLPDAIFIAPDAPFAHRSGGRQWFAVDDQIMRPKRLDAARRAFDRVVSEIVKREGFEDALDGVASGRWKVAALVTFAGLLPLPPTSSSTRIDILMMHGAEDKTIPSAATTVAASHQQTAAFTVTSKIYPGVGHTISSDEARDAANFLRDRFK